MENRAPDMKKRMLTMLIFTGILFGIIFGIHAFKVIMIKMYMSHHTTPAVTVSAMKVDYASWQPEIKATGSLRATLGVNVTTEAGGMVQDLYFKEGQIVKKDTLLVQLDIRPEVAQLHSLQANAELASITYNRDLHQYKVKAVSKEQVDTDAANLKSYNAQVQQQIANIALKTIRAPFSGRLGISTLNPGQYVAPGDKIVSLQTFDPMYVDFYLPQQDLSRVRIGQPVTLTVDTYPTKTFQGKITTIDSLVDVNNRNIQIEATIANPDALLYPGMFTYVKLDTGTSQRFLTLPQSAISFNPYGAIVYIIKPNGKDDKGNDILIANQQFVITGEVRGDQVTVLDGLKQGDSVVTSGQLKLKNGYRVMINNKVTPDNNPSPTIIDHEH